METNKDLQEKIKLGTHGENYGNWMSSPVFYAVISLIVIVAVLIILSLTIFHIVALCVLFSLITAVLILILIWISWVRKQYAFGGGGIMEQVHRTMLSHMDYDGKGRLLEVGCGSGALSIRSALTWPETEVTGIDRWGAVYNYSKDLCEKNAASEGTSHRCVFRQGDASQLDFPDESFDAVVSNYVYHNIMGADMHELLMESLRVLKKGGVFALNDEMKPKLYGDMDAFVQKLKDMGYQDVQIIDTAEEAFGSHKKAALMFLGHSRLLTGRK